MNLEEIKQRVDRAFDQWADKERKIDPLVKLRYKTAFREGVSCGLQIAYEAIKQEFGTELNKAKNTKTDK